MTPPVTPSEPDLRRLWVGTYPDDESEPGSGEGVWDVTVDASDGRFRAARLAVTTPAPSFVALSPDERTLYAVAETDRGRVAAFAVAADARPESLGDVSSLGSAPCHVVATPDAVWLANYVSGTFTTAPVRPDGGLGDPVAYEGSGTGPVTDRQEGPHAHFAVATPDGTSAWVVDLGADVARRYRVVPGGVEDAGTAVVLPAGTGPRHLVFGRPGTAAERAAFVVGELDDRVHVLATRTDDDGLLAADDVASVPACVTSWAGGEGAPSHVDLSVDGTRLYVAVRGPDVVATFAIEPDDASPARVRLTHLADSPLVGTWPRHFAVLDTAAGDVLVVAGQQSSTLEALRVRPRSGRAEHLASLALPSPACVVERRILEG